MDNTKINVAEDLLDEDLKQILGKRYQDVTHLFTEEAKQHRKDLRVQFTLRMAAFLGVMVVFFVWCMSEGLMSVSTCLIFVSTCTMVVGYLAGVCVSYLKRMEGMNNG